MLDRRHRDERESPGALGSIRLWCYPQSELVGERDHDCALPTLGSSCGLSDSLVPFGVGAAASSTVTQSPPAVRGVRVRDPSCAWVMLLTMARPRPTPACSMRMRLAPR